MSAKPKSSLCSTCTIFQKHTFWEMTVTAVFNEALLTKIRQSNLLVQAVSLLKKHEVEVRSKQGQITSLTGSPVHVQEACCALERLLPGSTDNTSRPPTRSRSGKSAQSAKAAVGKNQNNSVDLQHHTDPDALLPQISNADEVRETRLEDKEVQTEQAEFTQLASCDVEELEKTFADVEVQTEQAVTSLNVLLNDPEKDGDQSSYVKAMERCRVVQDTVDIEDHIWKYIQAKKPDIVREFMERNDCILERGAYFFQGGVLYCKLHVFSSGSSKMKKALEDLQVLYLPLRGELSHFVVELHNNAAKSKLEDLLKSSTAILIPAPVHQVIGPSAAVRRVEEQLFLEVDSSRNVSLEHDDVDDQRYRKIPDRTSSTLKIHILTGDIIKQPVDAIVNAANVDLMHGSGVAGIIRQAAGKQLEHESNDYIAKNGRLQVSHPMHTTAGNIQPPIKWVIHVAGPMASQYQDKQKLLQVLTDTFENVLVYASDKLCVRSVAIPAISSGIYGVDKRDVARCAAQAINNYEARSRSITSLNDVYFVDINQQTTQIFEEEFQSRDLSDPSYFNSGNHSTDVSDDASWHRTQRDVVKNEPSDYGKTANFDAADIARDSEIQKDSKTDAVMVENAASSSHDNANPIPVVSARKRMLKTENCVACSSQTKIGKKLNCNHVVCTDCIGKLIKAGERLKCPQCCTSFGNQPPGGSYSTTVLPSRLTGYEDCGTVEISFSFPDGIQTDMHRNPGQLYKGTQKKCYLPDNVEGREVCCLLKQAFDAQLLFTVGVTIAKEPEHKVVEWKDISLKTQFNGPFGYPDEHYLTVVKKQLADIGIVSS